MSNKIKEAQTLRYERTLAFIRKSDRDFETILDLGTSNPFSEIMQNEGYTVKNTQFDLDKHPQKLKEFKSDAITAFEILEHLLNPLGVLQNLNADHLFVTIPLRLWFSSAYKNPDDPWDRHFHEFEDWQFDWLLDHAGWEIVRTEKWTSPARVLGLRPLLRLFTPRYYAVEAVRNGYNRT